MEITSIRVKKNGNGGTVLGYATICLENCLVIHDIKIVEKNGSRILCFPARKFKKLAMENGEYSEVTAYMDIVHPANSEFRKYVEEEVLKIFDNNVKGVNHNE